jgi:trehalose-6-phosphatase
MNHDYTAFIKGVLKPVHEATSVDRTRAEHLLQLLGRQPKIVTLVNSARSLKGLDSYKGIVGVNLAAEHGTILLPAGEKQPIEFLIDRVGDIRSEIQVTASEYRRYLFSFLLLTKSPAEVNHTLIILLS